MPENMQENARKYAGICKKICRNIKENMLKYARKYVGICKKICRSICWNILKYAQYATYVSYISQHIMHILHVGNMQNMHNLHAICRICTIWTVPNFFADYLAYRCILLHIHWHISAYLYAYSAYFAYSNMQNMHYIDSELLFCILFGILVHIYAT